MTNGLRYVQAIKGGKLKFGPNGLSMDVGDIFTPKGLTKDIEAVEDLYGAKGYIDVTTSSRNLIVLRIPNTETGTMDLEFKIDEGQKSYVEKIDIRGNTKTKDKVIRRELAVSPGEVFDMVRVKVSKNRLEGLQYFEKVDTRSEATDPPITGRKNLIVGVDEKNTGNLTMGAGFSSVDSIVGFVEVSQGNFDLFHPPTFTGGGQKFRLRIQIGTERQDYLISFIEPWFLGRKLSLGVDLYHRRLDFQSPGNLYDEVRTGGRVNLTRSLWRDSIIGSLSYTLENVGILFNSGAHGPIIVQQPGSGTSFPENHLIPATAPETLLKEQGYSLISKAGFSLAYDTRNSALLPNKGGRTELFAEIAGGPLGGEKNFYKAEIRSTWYIKGFWPGHVLELGGRTGIAEAFDGTDDVPFYERYYLGGLYSLRGFKYRGISPREPGINEPIGGDTYWFGYAEYTIPIMERLRFALFYDIGDVQLKPHHYDFSNFSDNWGIGLRLNLPVGPLRLDYGIPINHDQFNSGSGRFQFGVGYTREF
jgi:outer membrane protein insertion porin family